MAAEAESVNPILALPRYIAIKGDNGLYLALKPDGVLAFDAPQVTRLTTHEVVYNADVTGRGRTFAMRSANNRFWIRDSDDDQIRAVQENPPSKFQDDARFNVVKLVKTSFLAFQSPADDLYLKLDCCSAARYKAVETTPDEYAQVEVSDASAYAIPLPPKVYFEANDGSPNDKKFPLTYTSVYNDNIILTQLTYPPSEHTDVVTLLDGNLSLCNPSPGTGYWILPNSKYLYTKTGVPSAHFEPQRNVDSTISLRTAGGKLIGTEETNYLRVVDSDKNAISFTPSRVGTKRQISDVKYLLGFACITDLKQGTEVASGEATNTSRGPMDLSIDVLLSAPKITSRTISWSDRFTYKEKYLKTILTAGVPVLIDGANGTTIVISSDKKDYPWNETVEEAIQIPVNNRYLIKNVQPGATARVTVLYNTARVRIPFTYNSKSDKEAEEKGIDGMFDATYVFNILSAIEIEEEEEEEEE